ncbi:uncharacterized protein LOC112601221 [Melanaphis sacchari]|uniref:uncharacterized protein LOC112601221 n=1 Tax=Melanaphis sacchari TaxID=742174 RepID=UPI000DC14DC2|nr:uncharacterized protein LOC112601221 [Melanaphis sacchari]
MKSSLVFVLAVCISYSIAYDPVFSEVNYRYDNDSIPEMLPRQMLGKSDEEIAKAVFDAYKIQIKIVSEYSGHVYDPADPYGYFKNGYPIPITQTYDSDVDLIFENNLVSGLTEYDQNVIIIKWAPDQIETNVEWKEANIRGNYHYINTTHYDGGNYHIQLGNLKYRANTKLTENTMNYPSSVPSSSISYESVKASFSGNLPVVTNVNDLSNLKFFLEKIASQHIADDVAKSIQPNVSIAVRQAIRPYIMYKNVSDPHFKGFNTSMPSGIQIQVDDVFTNGLNQTLQRVRNMTVDMANKKLIATLEMNMHDLSGTFRVQLTKNNKLYTDYAYFEIGNANVIPVSNMFQRDDCYADAEVKNIKVVIDPAKFNLSKDEEIEVNKVLVTEFHNTLVKKFKNTTCIALADMLNSKARDF